MKNSKLENLLRLKGINAQGYGTIAKLIMRDKRISHISKAIYAYICAFAGNGTTAFPSVALMVNEIGISEVTYYKHRKMLIDLNYIEITRERVDGRWGRNIYELIQNPVPLIDTSKLNTNKKDNEDDETLTESKNQSASLSEQVTEKQSQSLPADIEGFDTNELIAICFEIVSPELREYFRFSTHLSPLYKECSTDVVHTIGLAVLIARSGGLKFNKKIYNEKHLLEIFAKLTKEDLDKIMPSIAFVDINTKCRYILGCIFNKTVRGNKQNE